MITLNIRHLFDNVWEALRVRAGCVETVRVDMGGPELDPRRIPVRLPGEVVLNYPLPVGGFNWRIHCVSMGNPHCVVFVDEPDTLELPLLGPLLEHEAVFPNRTNVEFAKVVRRDHIRMRVWERGAGETLACGTGACATLVAASPEDNHVYQTDLPPLCLTASGQIDENRGGCYFAARQR